MAKRILVVLDDHADPIVPLIASLARGSGATVRLLRVVPVPRPVEGAYRRSITSIDQAMERRRHGATADLVAAMAELEGVPVESAVRFGDPAVETELEAEVFGADLVAASTSPTWLGPFIAPRIGDAIARRRSLPLLALRTEASTHRGGTGPRR